MVLCERGRRERFLSLFSCTIWKHLSVSLGSVSPQQLHPLVWAEFSPLFGKTSPATRFPQSHVIFTTLLKRL